MCNNEILLRNINTLCKEKNKKKSELESQLGVSNGYFSRLSKTPSTFPVADVLLKLSEIMGVNIDLLLKQDINNIGQNSRMIHELVIMLCRRTINGELKWKEISTIYPLPEEEIPYKKKLSRDYKVFIKDNPYEVKMDNGLTVGIQPLVFKQKKNSEIKLKSATGYEIYYISDDNKATICFSDSVNSVTKKNIEELYSYVVREIKDTEIDNPETINVIKSLLEM